MASCGGIQPTVSSDCISGDAAYITKLTISAPIMPTTMTTRVQNAAIRLRPQAPTEYIAQNNATDAVVLSTLDRNWVPMKSTLTSKATEQGNRRRRTNG